MIPTLSIALWCLALVQDPATTTTTTAPDAHPAAAQTNTATNNAENNATKPPAKSDEKAAAPTNGAKDPKREWKGLDKVVMIVNQDIIPAGRMQRDLDDLQKRRPLSDANERQRAQTEIQTAYVKASLAAQAGQDLGFDEKLVDRILSDRIDREIKARNGVVGMSALLESRNTTTDELRRSWREQLYGDVWEESVTGKGTGASTRASQDRFIRPGLRKFHFENALRRPEEVTALGGKPEMWKLQVLVLDCAAQGGVDKTLALANDLKKQIEDGANMSEIVQRYVPSDLERGVLEIPASQMRDAGIAEFASKAAEDALSTPTTFENPKGTYVRLVRMLRRTPAVSPDFNSPKCQRILVRTLQNELDQYRLDRAYRRLYSAAYIWPEELNQRDKRR